MKALVLVLVLASGVTAAAQQAAHVPASVSELEAAIKRDPGSARLHVALGLAYWERNDYPRALKTFQRAVKLGPRSAAAHNWLGVALSETADFSGAIAEFKKAIALDPKYGRAYTNLGSVFAKSGDFGEAVQVFQKALSLEPNSEAAHLNLAMALRDKGDLDTALEHLRPVAAADPANASIQYELGQTLRQSGDLGAAVTAFERALAIDPEMREGYYALGVALKQQSAALRKPRVPTPSPADDLFTRAQETAGRGDLNAAREQLTEALRLDETHAEAHNLLGFILGQQGQLPSALAHLERAVALSRQSAETHYNLGVALWYSGSKDRALSELRESVSLDPAAGAAYAFIGTALRDTADVAGARASLQRAIALLPPTAAIYVDLGITYLRVGELERALGQLEAGLNLPSPALPTPDWDAAIAGVRQALATNPSSTPAATEREARKATAAAAHNTLGLLLGRRGADSSDVAAEFREAIRLRPDYAEAYNNLGLVLIQADKDEEGIAALREAVRLRPGYADAHDNLGAALTPTNAVEAIAELEKAVALAPGAVKAEFNLALAYGASPGLGPAKEIEQLRKVIALAPTFARAHLALGKALLQDGKGSEAVEALAEAARLEPDSGEAHYQLGLALARAGRTDEATRELQKGRHLVAADDRNQNANLDIAEGRAALEKGDLEQAAAKFRHALQLRPESSDAQRYLDAALGKGREADASALSDDPKRVAEIEAYIREGRFKDVESLLTEYVKGRPRSSWGWYALGYSLFAQQKIGESITALSKSLELDIRNAEAHKTLGRDLMIIGRFDAAQLEFEQGISYSPGSAEIHYNLGRLFSIQDNWEAARQAFEAALRIDPSNVEALDGLGFALEALGDDAGAVSNYEKAIALNEARKGSFASPHVNLSAYYNRTGDPKNALEYSRQALALDPKSDRAWFQKARADDREGRLDEAVDAVNRAISFNPRASSYYYVLAGLYRRLGKAEESQKALEAFTRLERETNELEKKRRSKARNDPSGGGMTE